MSTQLLSTGYAAIGVDLTGDVVVVQAAAAEATEAMRRAMNCIANDLFPTLIDHRDQGKNQLKVLNRQQRAC